MNETRKNKSKQSVNWPSTSYFTIIELLKNHNPSFKEITLRVRLTNAITSGKVVEIGTVPGGKGRPQKVFCLAPATPNILNKAIQNNIVLVESVEKIINVVNVSPRENSPPVNIGAMAAK